MSERRNRQIEPADSFYGRQSRQAGTPNYQYHQNDDGKETSIGRRLEEMKENLNNYFFDFISERAGTGKAGIAKGKFLENFNQYPEGPKKLYLNNVIKNFFENKSTEDCSEDSDDIIQIKELIGGMKGLDKMEVYATITNACKINNQQQSNNYTNTYPQGNIGIPNQYKPPYGMPPTYYDILRQRDYLPFIIIGGSIVSKELGFHNWKPQIRKNSREIQEIYHEPLGDRLFRVFLGARGTSESIIIGYAGRGVIDILDENLNVVDTAIINRRGPTQINYNGRTINLNIRSNR